MTPYHQGQAAAREGKPKSANPFPKQISQGDDYPGPYANWFAGWDTEIAMMKHDEDLRK